VALPRASYPDLFAVIGTTYGVGDGSTTFNLPNFNGRVPVGVDNSTPDPDFQPMGKMGGEKKHAQTLAEMAAHNHAPSPASVWSSSGGAANWGLANGTGINVKIDAVASMSLTGSNTPANILQPYTTLLFIIKT